MWLQQGAMFCGHAGLLFLQYSWLGVDCMIVGMVPFSCQQHWLLLYTGLCRRGRPYYFLSPGTVGPPGKPHVAPPPPLPPPPSPFQLHGFSVAHSEGLLSMASMMAAL